MVELAGQVAVPPQHVVDGRTVPSLIDSDSTGDDGRRLIDIRSSKDKPDDAYVAVNPVFGSSSGPARVEL